MHLVFLIQVLDMVVLLLAYAWLRIVANRNKQMKDIKGYLSQLNYLSSWENAYQGIGNIDKGLAIELMIVIMQIFI